MQAASSHDGNKSEICVSSAHFCRSLHSNGSEPLIYSVSLCALPSLLVSSVTYVFKFTQFQLTTLNFVHELAKYKYCIVYVPYESIGSTPYSFLFCSMSKLPSVYSTYAYCTVSCLVLNKINVMQTLDTESKWKEKQAEWTYSYNTAYC